MLSDDPNADKDSSDEVLEDAYLLQKMKDSSASGFVSRESVMRLLQPNLSKLPRTDTD